MNKKIKSLFLVLMILCLGFANVYSDPSAPPPPPPVTKVFYYKLDEFMDCGTMYEKTITYCPNPIAKQTVVSKSGRIISDSTVNICGVSNNEQVTETLNDSWVCPKGKAIAQLHEPGELDSQFDTISLSDLPPYKSDTYIDMYFNAYIPACVNRIPMMNFELNLYNENGTLVSSKTGLYAKHETLSYDSNPMGGLLENFYFPTQTKFKESVNLSSNLKTYRMWSFRQRFVEGLQRIVDEKDLQLPNESLNVDSLDSTKPNDFEDIYFSRDFMMGAYSVDNQNNAPVGESLEQELSSICNLDVTDLNLVYLSNANDLKDSLKDLTEKAEIISALNNDKTICNVDDSSQITDVDYIKKLRGTDSSTAIRNLNIDLLNLDAYWTDNAIEFQNYANSFWTRNSLSVELKEAGYLSYSNPREEILDVNSITTNSQIENYNLNVDVLSISGITNSTELSTYIYSLSNADLSELLIDNSYLGQKELVKSILSTTIVNNKTLNVNLDVYQTDIILNLDIYSIIDYNGLASIELTLLHQTNSESSWNWRSLESLTLTQLGRCLYNWDECLFNPRSEPTVSWDMLEVADLGYGPRMDSLAYVWSKSQLESEYDLTYGYHFDGARGEQVLDTPLTIYRSCNENDAWISDEEYYACYNQTVYKCYYGLESDEILFELTETAYFGDTVAMDLGHGFVCINTTTGPKWKEVNCYDETSVIS